MSDTMSPTRRRLLQTMGLTAGSGLFPSLGGRRAAAADTIPTRLVIFHAGYGINRSLWAPKGSETSFELSEVHQPLTPYKDQLIYMDGLDMQSSLYDPNGASNAHAAGQSHALSGNRRRRASTGNYDWSAITIDQFIAQSINRPSPVTRFPSLELGAPLDLNDVRISSDGSGAFLPAEWDPDKTFKRLFPTATGGTTAPALNDPAAERRRSVLEFVNGRFKALQPKLSQLDKTRFDAHASAIRDLEARLNINVGPATVTCNSDANAIANARALKAKGGSYSQGQAWYEAAIDGQLRLIQLALACDLTRVVSISFSDPEKSIGYTPGMFGTTDYHDLVHKTDGGIGGPLKSMTVTSLMNNPDAIAIRKKHALFEATNFAKFLQLMRAVPTPDGKTLLDHTAVLWCGHIGWGGHHLSYLPWILAGSAGGYFKTGRYLQLPRVASPKLGPTGFAEGLGWVSDTKLGQPHNNLFVSLANAMGVQTNTFGDPMACTGPLAGLRG